MSQSEGIMQAPAVAAVPQIMRSPCSPTWEAKGLCGLLQGWPGQFHSSWPWRHPSRQHIPLAPHLRKRKECARACIGLWDSRRSKHAKRHPAFSCPLRPGCNRHPLHSHLLVAHFVCLWQCTQGLWSVTSAAIHRTMVWQEPGVIISIQVLKWLLQMNATNPDFEWDSSEVHWFATLLVVQNASPWEKLRTFLTRAKRVYAAACEDEWSCFVRACIE